MGTKGKKPISAMEKRQMKELEKEKKTKKEVKKEERETKKISVSELDEKIIGRAKRELIDLKVVTPYQAKEKLGIPYSLSKKLLRYLEREGVLNLYSSNHRIRIYVPAGK
jgi:ribosomal protein S25